MAYRMSVDPARQVLTIRYEGLVAVAERTESLAEMLRLLDVHGIRRVLADMTDAKIAADPFDESNAFASKLACEAIARKCQIAYVATAGARTNQVVETLATARGLRFGKFTERDAALEWLGAPTQVAGEEAAR